MKSQFSTWRVRFFFARNREARSNRTKIATADQVRNRQGKVRLMPYESPADIGERHCSFASLREWMP
jgi:hypothetical protein